MKETLQILKEYVDKGVEVWFFGHTMKSVNDITQIIDFNDNSYVLLEQGKEGDNIVGTHISSHGTREKALFRDLAHLLSNIGGLENPETLLKNKLKEFLEGEFTELLAKDKCGIDDDQDPLCGEH